MRKTFQYCLLVFLTVGQFTLSDEASAIQEDLAHKVIEAEEELPSAKEIIANYYESIGGEMALDGVDSLTFSADFVAHGANRTDGTVNLRWTKEGWHYQFDTETTDTTYWKSSDGKYWRKVRGVTSEMRDVERIKFQEILPVPMHGLRWLDYEDVDTMIIVHGLVDFRDSICYHLEFKPEGGNPIHRFFERESGRLVKLEYQSEGTPAAWVLSDYQEVEEVWIPMRRENYFSQILEYEVVKQTVKIGGKVDKKWFIKPNLEQGTDESDDPFGGMARDPFGGGGP